jgi:putative cell wall-binding protein
VRARITIAIAVAAALATTTALAEPAATWTYAGEDAFTADTPGELTVTLRIDAPNEVREDQPLGYRHFVVDGEGAPRAGVEVAWSHGDASGTATTDADGGVVLPATPFTLPNRPALGGAGDQHTLEFELPEGDHVVFSDLVDLTPPTVRRAGPDRYATAAEVSRTHFPPKVETVYVATGENFADALAAGPVATAAGAPLLLVTRGSVPAATRAELKRLAPDEIVVLGGGAAVSEDVERELAPYAGTIRRISGIDRYDTAARVARDTYFQDGVARAYVANGASFADALGAAARAAVDNVPVLLVSRDDVPTATGVAIDVLGITHVTVVGGSAAVSPMTYAALAQRAGSATRRSGTDRYATSAEVADRSGSGTRPLIVATGENFPDALTAGPLAGRLNADLLLVRPAEIPAVIADRAKELAPLRVIGLGGGAAMTDPVLQQLDGYRTPLTPLWLDPVVAGGQVEIAVAAG